MSGDQDPIEGPQRRVTAAAQHYGLSRDEYEGPLFVDSERTQPVTEQNPPWD